MHWYRNLDEKIEQKAVEPLEVQAPTSPGPVRPSNWFVTDAILISAFSAIAYLVAFKYEQAYLGYFGVSEQFVDLSLERVVLVFSVLLFVLTTSYQIVSGLSLFSHASIKFVVFTFFVEIILFGLAAFLYFAIGVNWFTVTVLMLFVLFVLNDLIGMLRKSWAGSTWRDWCNERQESFWNVPPRPDLDSIIIDKIGYRNWAVIPLLFFILPNLGSIAGGFVASNKKVFESYSLGSSDAVLVGQRGDTWLFVEISNQRTTGKILLRKIDPTAALVLMQKIYATGIYGVGRPIHKPTFTEWWASMWKEKTVPVGYGR
jgi:hypothetical protein